MGHSNIGRREFVKGASLASIAALSAGAVRPSSAAASEAAASGYTDGTYTAIGTGMGGDVPVTVVIANGAIASVEIGPNSETDGIGSNAVKQLPAQIVAANGIENVSAVSGASITSKAIFSAVQDCLSQASGQSASANTPADNVILNEDIYSNAKWSFEIAPDPIPEDKITETVTADYIVIGAGTSGLVTAMAAAEEGVDVCVIASSATPVSRGGSNAAFNSRLQKELGREFPLEQAKPYGSSPVCVGDI
mgnify:CR=1 FL=1